MEIGEEPGVLPHFERHGVLHPLEIRPDSIAPIRMEARESSHNPKGGLKPNFLIQE